MPKRAHSVHEGPSLLGATCRWCILLSSKLEPPRSPLNVEGNDDLMPKLSGTALAAFIYANPDSLAEGDGASRTLSENTDDESTGFFFPRFHGGSSAESGSSSSFCDI